MDRIEQELDELRSAMEWSASGQIERGLQIAADLFQFSDNRNYGSEGAARLVRLLAVEKNEHGQVAHLGLSHQPEFDL